MLYEIGSSELEAAREAFELISERAQEQDVLLRDAWETLSDFFAIEIAPTETFGELWNELKQKAAVALVLHCSDKDNEAVLEILRNMEVPNYVQQLFLAPKWER